MGLNYCHISKTPLRKIFIFLKGVFLSNRYPFNAKVHLTELIEAIARWVWNALGTILIQIKLIVASVESVRCLGNYIGVQIGSIRIPFRSIKVLTDPIGARKDPVKVLTMTIGASPESIRALVDLIVVSLILVELLRV